MREPRVPSPPSLMSGITLPPGLVYKGAPAPVMYTNNPAPAHNPHNGLAGTNGVHIVTNGGPSSNQSGKHNTFTQSVWVHDPITFQCPLHNLYNSNRRMWRRMRLRKNLSQKWILSSIM